MENCIGRLVLNKSPDILWSFCTEGFNYWTIPKDIPVIGLQDTPLTPSSPPAKRAFCFGVIKKQSKHFHPNSRHTWESCISSACGKCYANHLQILITLLLPLFFNKSCIARFLEQQAFIDPGNNALGWFALASINKNDQYLNPFPFGCGQIYYVIGEIYKKTTTVLSRLKSSLIFYIFF